MAFLVLYQRLPLYKNAFAWHADEHWQGLALQKVLPRFQVFEVKRITLLGCHN